MLKWVFGADTGPYRSALQQMRKETTAFSGSVKGQLAGMFAGGALIAGAQKVISHFARIKDLADRFGASSSSIQKVGAAATQAGSDMETIAKALTTATRNSVEAANGNDTLSAAFERLGVSAADFASLSLEDKLLALNKGYGESTSSAQGLSDVMQILGKSGAEAIPLLTQSFEDLKAQMDETKTASEGVVNTMANLDDRIAEGQQTVSVAGAWLIGLVTSIFGAWAQVCIGAIDIVVDGFGTLSGAAVNAGTVIAKALSGDMKGAKAAYDDFFTDIKGGLNNIVIDARKTASAIKGTFEEGLGGVDAPNEKAAKLKAIEDAKAAAAAEKEIMTERKKLAGEIGDLEEDSRQRQLSLAEKILDADKRRAALIAQMNGSGDENEKLTAKRNLLKLDASIADMNEKATAERVKAEGEIAAARKDWVALSLENKRAGMSDADKLKSLTAERDALNAQARAANSKGDTVNAVALGKKSWGVQDRINSLQAGIAEAAAADMDSEKSSKFSRFGDPEKVASLAKDRDQLKTESDEAFARGDRRKGYELRTQARGVDGQILDLKDKQMEEPNKEIDRLEELGKKGPEIKTSNLAEIGGGGGTFTQSVDVSKQLLAEVQKITAIAQQGVANTKPGSPDANW